MSSSFISQGLFGLLLLTILFALAVIDVKKMILPNSLNLLLAVCGIGQSIIQRQPSLTDAILGALASISIIAIVTMSFRKFRGMDGLGIGDQKLVAAGGLWIGWQHVPSMLLVSSVAALGFVLLQAMRGYRFERSTRVPFGPFLGAGTLAAWFNMAMSS